jgi:transposase
MAPGEASSAEHQCEWREKAEALAKENSSLRADYEKLKRQLLGPKSEKMPGVEKELRRDKKVDREAALRTRRERRKAKADLPKATTLHPVPAAERQCPKCGRTNLRRLGRGRETVVYEYVPAKVIAHHHLRETLSCPCGEYVKTAELPLKWAEKSQYAPSLVAHLIVAKCADSIPLYRLEKDFHRIGLPISRSTMTDLYHRAAELLAPLVARLLALIRAAEIVRADETSKRVLAEGHCRTGFIWTFRARVPEPLIAYVFAPSRSGETPRRILGGSKGELVVDGYTGYNTVISVNGRERVGCHAHLRRYFFEALPTASLEARRALDFILDLYRVEHLARASGIEGTEEHLALRQSKSAPIRDEFKTWIDRMRGQTPPKSPLGEALRYATNQWVHLGRFLADAGIPLDNNESESALRRVALGRKNFLFVGNDVAGEHLAGLYSLVATCEANDVNPLEYLPDVLERINTHPASKIDDLLPHRWTRAASPETREAA